MAESESESERAGSRSGSRTADHTAPTDRPPDHHLQPGVACTDIVKMVGKATAREPVTVNPAGSMFAALQQAGATGCASSPGRSGLAVGGGVESANNAASMLAVFDEVADPTRILAIRTRRAALVRRPQATCGIHAVDPRARR